MAVKPLVGSQVPRVANIPKHATTAGEDASKVALAGGLVLDEAQLLVMDAALGERPDGLWSAKRVGLLVPRQNMKTFVLMTRALLGLFVLGERIAWTSHQFRTSMNSFEEMKRVIDSTPAFRSRVRSIRTSNGSESITTKDGGALRFIARSKNAGRGFTCDTLLCDEAQEMSTQDLASLLPTMSAVPNPQVWLCGTVPDEHRNDSTVWTQTRDRGRSGEDPTICWLEWSAAEDLVDLDDRSLWAKANPALGTRITEDAIITERAALTDEDFARERLAIWPSQANSGLFGSDWVDLGNPESTIEKHLAFGVAVSIDRSFAAIGAAGLNAEGLLHVEGIECKRGSGWLVKTVQQLLTTHGKAPVVIDGRGPAANLIPAFEAEGIEVTVANTNDVTTACADMADRVREGQLVHLNDPGLNQAVMDAKKRPVGDRWAIGRRTSVADVSPLEAVLLASIGVHITSDYDLLASVF